MMFSSAMIRVLIASIAFALLSQCPSFAQSGGGAKKIRVVSWNIEWFPGKSFTPAPENEPAHFAAVQKELKRLDPDILVASEIRDWAAFQKAVEAVPGLRVAVVSAYLGSKGELWRQQIAIATKLECKAAWAQAFAPTIPAIPRGFAFAALVDPATNKLLLVYGVHLKSNRSKNDAETLLNYSIREESAHQILTHMSTMERVTFKPENIRGWVLAGDFNTNDDGRFGDRTVRILEEAGFWNSWRGIPAKNRLTWRGDDLFEPTTFDFIFLKGLGRPVARMGETAPETSDHDAVVLEVDLRD